jgi:tRNA(Ile2) C34 agmatinyltransferase TiaS
LWYHRIMTEEERAEAGRKLAAFRTRKERTCPVCGKVFETWGKGIYCSTECRVKAWRTARRQPPTTAPRED